MSPFDPTAGASRDLRAAHDVPLRVLVVDDDILTAFDLIMLVNDLGGDSTGAAHNARDAFRAVEMKKPDVVLMDIDLGVDDGIGAAQAIRCRHGPAIVFVSGSTDPDTAGRVQRFGAAPFVPKPVDRDDLGRAILSAVRSMPPARLIR